MKKLLRALAALMCAFVATFCLVACGGSSSGGGSAQSAIGSFVGHYQAISGAEAGEEFDETYVEETLRANGYNLMIEVDEDDIILVTPNGTQEIDEFTVSGSTVEFEFDSTWTDTPEPATLTMEGSNIRMDYEYDGEECYALFEPITEEEFDQWEDSIDAILNGGGTSADLSAFVGYYQAVGGFEDDFEYDEAMMEEARANGTNIIVEVDEDGIVLLNPNGIAEASDIYVQDGVVHFGIDASYRGNPKPATLQFQGNYAVMDYEYNGKPAQIILDPISEAEFDQWEDTIMAMI